MNNIKTRNLYVAYGICLLIVGSIYGVRLAHAEPPVVQPNNVLTEENEDASYLCGLSVVECQDEINKQSSFSDYDITKYATNPTHEETVKAIYDAMPEIKNKFDADAYIKARRPNSPVRGGMVERASEKYGVDMKLILALMQNDSAFGTAGLGARTRNPGNIANRDDGHTHTYPSWEEGVEGVARWISKHKTN